MKNLFKKILSFWQEIVFIFGMGLHLIGMVGNIHTIFQHTASIVFFLLYVIILVCLVGQFFWKNKTMSIFLAIMLGLGSLYMILAVLSDLAKPDLDGMSLSSLMFAFAMFAGFCFAAFTMPFKYPEKKREIPDVE